MMWLVTVKAYWYASGIGYVNEAQVKISKVDLRAIDKMLSKQSNLDHRIKSACLSIRGWRRPMMRKA